MHDDGSTRGQFIEHLARALSGAHAQAQCAVCLIGKTVYGGELKHVGRVCPAGGVVEDSAAADRGQLVTIADEHDPGMVLAGALGLSRGDAGCLERGRDDQQPTPGASQCVICCGEGRGLASAGSAFDDDQGRGAGDSGDRLPLSRVEPSYKSARHEPNWPGL